MRYSTEPRERKYVKEYGFLSFTRKFGDKYGKKLMATTTKTGIDAAKSASKRVFLIASAYRPKNKENKEENEVNEMGEIYILPEKLQQTIDDLK